MATTEAQISVNTNLQKQDLSNLEISNLTPLSPEVISRQATINIGTIGHVAHGKSTVVKAISGVQTVRFKNELERNITIKLERLSEHKIRQLLGSESLRNKYEKKQMQYVEMLAEKRQRAQEQKRALGMSKLTDYNSNNNNYQQELIVSHLRRSARKNSLTLSNSSGYGSGMSIDESDGANPSARLKNKAKRRRHTICIENQINKRVKTDDEIKTKTPIKGEYIVESINCVESVNTKPLFFVKWLGYSNSDNTWESLENLWDCAQLELFVEQKMQTFEQDISTITSDLELQFIEFAANFDHSTINIRDIERFEPLELQIDLILLAQFRAANSRSQREPQKISERALYRMMLQRSCYKRKKQLHMLHQFETRLNEVEQPAPPIRVENNVDLECIDSSFVYIHENISGAGVPITESGILGCKCENVCCAASTKCCARLAGELYAYKKSTRRLRLQPGSAIYECNSRCTCDVTCTNRLVQHGRKHELVLFKTSDGRGWGVRTPHALPKGEFVCEYVGEIITTEEANCRGKAYDDNGRTYLFDLDYNTTAESEFTIDAANYGNISHFINHSCDPNLAVFPCWINHLNSALPHLVFFTLRPVKAGEELSFDYIRADNEEDPYENLSDGARVKCRCGAAKCRKVLF